MGGLWAAPRWARGPRIDRTESFGSVPVGFHGPKGTTIFGSRRIPRNRLDNGAYHALMRHTLSLIVAAIVPLAVVATSPVATTTAGPASGSDRTEVRSGQGNDAFAAKKSRSAKNRGKSSVQRRANSLRPRSPRQGVEGIDVDGPTPPTT